MKTVPVFFICQVLVCKFVCAPRSFYPKTKFYSLDLLVLTLSSCVSTFAAPFAIAVHKILLTAVKDRYQVCTCLSQLLFCYRGFSLFPILSISHSEPVFVSQRVLTLDPAVGLSIDPKLTSISHLGLTLISKRSLIASFTLLAIQAGFLDRRFPPVLQGSCQIAYVAMDF